MTGQDTTTALIENFAKQPRFKARQLAPQLSEINETNRHDAFKQAQHNIGELAKAGVLILAGTDAPNSGTAHGISLHGELALLVESGLTPNQALKAATSNVAIAFKLPLRGYISQQMKADFVLLNHNPELDISNTMSIAAVYKNGFRINYGEAKVATSDKLITATLLADFEQDLSSSLGTVWSSTTDQRFGGSSTAVVVRESYEADNADKYVNISGKLDHQFAYPWAGIYLPLSSNNKGQYDITAVSNVSLIVKGTAGDYKVMLFSAKQPMRPVEVMFKVTEQWQQHRVSLSHISPVLLQSVNAIAIVAAKPQTDFELMLDNIWLN